MAISFVQQNSNVINNTGQITITTSLTGVTAGDLIVVGLFWGLNGNSVVAQSVSDGTNFASQYTAYNNGNGEYGQMYFFLSAKGGNVTYTGEFNAGVPYPVIAVMQFHDNVPGTTWQADGASNGNGATNSSSVTTGNITTTETPDVAAFFFKLYDTGQTPSAIEINSVAATNSNVTNLSAYYTLPIVPFTGQGTATYSGNTNWVSLLAAFNAIEPSSAPGSTTADCWLAALQVPFTSLKRL